MKTVFLAAAALATLGGLSMLDATPAQARDYRYCLKQPGDAGGPGRCEYDTYAQCLATASGLVAECNINPRVAFAQQQPGAPVHHRRHRH
jgi:hypothetical protein